MKTSFMAQASALVLALHLFAACAQAFGEAPASPPAKFPSAPASATTEDESSTIRVNVKLVNVYVTVTDPVGAPVAGLLQPDFQVSEDDVPQKVSVFSAESELPLSIVMSIDASLSTRTDLGFELESARRFVHAILRPVDALSLFRFAETVHEIVPFTSELARIDRGIDRVKVGAGTALYDAVYLGADALQRRQGRKVMVVITDGGDTMSSITYSEALRAAQQSEAIIYSIIVVPIAASAGRNTGGEHALIQLSSDTGGKYFYADTTGRLDAVFRQISSELRTQYLLAYYPARRVSDSDFRQIEIKLAPASSATAGDRENFKLRYRTGYYTSKAK